MNQDGDRSTQKRKRRTLQYVSRHFVPQAEAELKSSRSRRKRRKLSEEKENIRDREGSAVREVDTDELKQRARRVDTSAPPKHTNCKTSKLEAGTNGQKKKPITKSRAVAVPTSRKLRKKTRTKSGSNEERETENLEEEKAQKHNKTAADLVPWQQVLAAPVEEQQSTFQRIFFGLNVDALSSDSDLTDVPEDLGPDPFTSPSSTQKKHKSRRKAKNGGKNVEVVAVKEKKGTSSVKTKSKTTLTKSPYFPHAHKPRPTFLSTLPFPPLHLERFGLMQERLCHDPFRLLLATIFLNKTPGQRAMPIFFNLMKRYPTPEKLAQAEQPDVTQIIHELGFQNQRARKCIAMAQKWVEDPPVKGRRRRKPGYPTKGDGKDIKADEVVDDADERVAWEISHLPGLGPYSHDSWRMFCRDELRGLANGYDGEGATREEGQTVFEPEWKRVLPADKELRAWMTWMWMKEGWVWNKETGERTKASEELMELARGRGNVVLESEANTLLVKSLDDKQPSPMKLAPQDKKDVKVEVPAGQFMPQPGV